MAVHVRTAGIVDQFTERALEDPVDRSLGGGVWPHPVKPLAKLSKIVGQQAFKIGTGGRLTDDVFQPAAVVVAHIEFDRFVIPFGLGRQTSKPASQQSGIGPDPIQ